MKNWRGVFEIVKFPIEVLFIAYILSGTGNLLANNIFGIGTLINNDYVNMFAETLQKSGQFIIVNFPFLFLIRLVARKNGTSVTIMSALVGYIAFLITTMLVCSSSLTSTAYSSILGLSLTKSNIASYTGITKYPLQTGLIGALCVVGVTLLSFNQSKKRNEYGLFSFVSKETMCVILTLLYSILVGVVISFLWPYVMMCVDKLVNFISADTTNPVNLTLYGILDGLLSTFNLGTWIRNPFWYNIQGGSWVGVSGSIASGDVGVWSAQILANSVTGQAGRFITPYYVLNIFAVPGIIWAMCTLETNPIQKGKVRTLCIIATIVSMVSGTLLPIELMLLFLAPLLYVLHIAMTGVLFGVLQGFHIYLGFNSTETSTMTSLPGTLPELITYVTNDNLRNTILLLLIVGAITLVVYFFVTRLYFERLAIDLFKTGDEERLVKSTLKAIGGIENLKAIESNCFNISVALYDTEKIDIPRLKRLGASRIVLSNTGYYVLSFGGKSTMLRKGIEQERRVAE